MNPKLSKTSVDLTKRHLEIIDSLSDNRGEFIRKAIESYSTLDSRKNILIEQEKELRMIRDKIDKDEKEAEFNFKNQKYETKNLLKALAESYFNGRCPIDDLLRKFRINEHGFECTKEQLESQFQLIKKVMGTKNGNH